MRISILDPVTTDGFPAGITSLPGIGVAVLSGTRRPRRHRRPWRAADRGGRRRLVEQEFAAIGVPSSATRGGPARGGVVATGRFGSGIPRLREASRRRPISTPVQSRPHRAVMYELVRAVLRRTVRGPDGWYG